MVLASLLCLSLTVYFEARGESDLGQQQVAQVVINRSESQHQPICKIVYAKNQFSWTLSHPTRPKSTDPDWQRVQKNVKIVLDRKTTSNVLYFKNIHCKRVISRKIIPVAVIGRHIFYKESVSMNTNPK